MNWPAIIVLVLLAGYILSETFKITGGVEGFVVPPRSDIGPASEGWTEESGWDRDLRYSETFVDIQGIGVATDFCRAINKTNDEGSLKISCALGTREGMSTTEYNGPTKGEGFRFSRDDYWRQNKRRMDYCRILRDADTGLWNPVCAIAGPDGFKKEEMIDSEPPHSVQLLLEAYEGALVWFRWVDDRHDYIDAAGFTQKGEAVFPSMLKPTVSRGLQLNRWPQAAQDAGIQASPLQDYLQWGEKGTHELHQSIPPRQIRAIAFWVWWDGFEKDACIMESYNPITTGSGKNDRFVIGMDGAGTEYHPTPVSRPAIEVRPEVIQAIGQVTEPAAIPSQPRPSKTAAYFFEIWDQQNRIMRLEAPMDSAKVGKWQHVVFTTTASEDWWPTWQIWIDGALAGERQDGRMSPAMTLSTNFIGKNVRGCIQDFRVYSTAMAPAKIKAAMAWTKKRLHPLP
jgi:hypothetical protein